MKNLDTIQKEKSEILMKINAAVKEGNEEAFGEAFTQFTDMLQEAVMAEAKGLIQAADNKILTARGTRTLTSKERDYYEKVRQAMLSKNPQQSLAGVDDILPTTVIDAVFQDIQEAHPLLNAINFQNTGPLVEILISLLDGRYMAAWGKLCSEVEENIFSGFDKIDLTLKKLSAYLPVCKAMLELGPEYLDRYVRTVLAEAIANGLEDGIVNGNGLDEPIGMIRNIDGALDPILGLPELIPVPLTEITPATYGALISSLSTNRNNLSRSITEVIFIVNPVDYFTKLLPAVSYQRADGSWNNEIFPFPTKVIQSVHMTQGEAIIGLGNRYFLGLGTSKGGRIEYSDHYHFLEDERIYLTKLYGNGRPLDSTSFILLNIANLTPVDKRVYVSNMPSEISVSNDPLNVAGVYDARLASLKIGALILSPAFNKSVHVYTATTTDATNKITGVAMDGEATIEIDVNDGTAVVNGESATWEAGANTVEITVTSGTESEIYSATITKN